MNRPVKSTLPTFFTIIWNLVKLFKGTIGSKDLFSTVKSGATTVVLFLAVLFSVVLLDVTTTTLVKLPTLVALNTTKKP